ncbi:VOC family protein [Hoeflea poritis]|uniref:VOC family protein n=1 Tax=Hoeflea poritis TaxID=2993659 RepID=A0ABT4VKJ6_9HYPH|nr:VOC family protein [Hoeflea poritis]MDA4845185.1 VOC family protein [Hoeflea poritis]
MIRKIGFVGIRTGHLDEMAAIFRDCLGASLQGSTETSVSFAASDGTAVEIYRESDEFHRFFDTGPVVGFEVEDFNACREALLEKGVEFLTEVQQNDRNAWQHFRLPDGTVAEIIGPRKSSIRAD